MKKFLVNVFATTGLSLLLLSGAALLLRGQCLYLRTVFQVFGANVAMHLLFTIIRRAECRYLLLERALDICSVLLMLAASGTVFRWFDSTPVWILPVIGVAVYIASILLDILSLRREAQEINRLLQRRGGYIKKEAPSATRL